MRVPKNSHREHFVLCEYRWEPFGLRGSGTIFGKRPFKGSPGGHAGAADLKHGDLLWVHPLVFKQGRGKWWRRA